MRLIFGDDWNDTPRSLRLFGNDVISLDLGSLMIFVYLYTCTQSIQKQIVEYDIKSRKYTEEYSSVDKVGPEILLARKSFFSVDLITSSYIVRWPHQGRSTQYLLLNIIYNCGFKIQPVDRNFWWLLLLLFFFFAIQKNISCTPCTPKISLLNALNRVCVSSKYIQVI